MLWTRHLGMTGPVDFTSTLSHPLAHEALPLWELRVMIGVMVVIGILLTILATRKH